MFEVWLQMSDTNIDTENPSDLPALVIGKYLFPFLIDTNIHWLSDVLGLGVKSDFKINLDILK